MVEVAEAIALLQKKKKKKKKKRRRKYHWDGANSEQLVVLPLADFAVGWEVAAQWEEVGEWEAKEAHQGGLFGSWSALLMGLVHVGLCRMMGRVEGAEGGGSAPLQIGRQRQMQTARVVAVVPIGWLDCHSHGCCCCGRRHGHGCWGSGGFVNFGCES